MSNQSNEVLLAYDHVEIGKPKIVADNKRFLKIEAIISRVGVYEYDDGMWLKCASELRKATRTARYAKLTLNDHPETKVIMSQADLFGGVERPFFDNDKMHSILSFDKEFVPEETLKKVRNGELKDVSIGFYYRPDYTPGWHRDVNTGKPTHYDGIMRDIMIDHVVGGVGPGMAGRCRFPQCGIGLNTILKRFSIGEDKVVKRGGSWCVVHCHPDGTPGKAIKCYSISEFGDQGAKSKAEAMHRAIQARKSGSAQSIIDLASILNVPECGCDTLTKFVFGDAEQPTKAWMDNCKAKAQSFADDPGAFCGWVWYHGPAALKRSFGSSSVLTLGGKDMSEETDYAKCVREKKEEGMTDEEAREACQEKKTDQEKLQSAYDKCLADKKEAGMTQEEAEKACEVLKPTATDQEQTPWQKCLAKHMEAGLSMEEAADKCKEEGVAADQETVPEPVEHEKPLPTELEICIASRMETMGEDEATAKAWCEDELAGLHEPTEEIVDSIQKLKAKEAELNKRR